MDFKHSIPIYTQIIHHVQYGIISGEYLIGSKLPSVREMALKMKVNHNTVQRVYNELDLKHITETKRGIGTFVVNDEQLIYSLKKEMIQEKCADFINEIRQLHLSNEEIIETLKKQL